MNYIRHTIQLAKKAVGQTSPNPLVGAVIVKNNKIIARGYHKKAGDKHAEIEAIEKAGQKARGATMYVNLEPCCHFGQTPPCARAIIKAGIKKVHIGMLDPNSKVSGKGKTELEKAGIKVIMEEENIKEARELNEIFIKYMTDKRPFVAAKWAMSLDGKIAASDGSSKWITNKKSRQIVHKIRRRYDAIMVGVNTVIKDDPLLNTRLKTSLPIHQPARIIIDSTGRTPLNANILNKETCGQTIIATTEKMIPSKEKKYQKLGAEILRVKSKKNRVCLTELLKKLAKKNITSILIEGGGELMASAFAEKIIDKIYIFIGEKIIGGKNAITPVAGKGIKTIADAKNFKISKLEKIDNNILITAYPHDKKNS